MLLQKLQALADRLGLVKVVVDDAAPAEVVPHVATKKVSLAELTATIRSEDVRALAALPAEMSVEFDQVFETAGIAPRAHGWTILRLAELLRTEQYQSMEREAAQTAILGVLAADDAAVEELLEDALARDKALDAFEAFVERKMEQRLAARARSQEQLLVQIASLQEQHARFADETDADREQWRQWRQRKIDAEKELARALNYLLDEPRITIEESNQATERRSDEG